MDGLLHRLARRWRRRERLADVAARLSADDASQLAAVLSAAGKLPGWVDARSASYANDGLVTFHHSDFLHDPLFQEAYRLGRATGSWKGGDIAWRAYVACWAARRGVGLPGDFVECGVERGGLARTVMHYVGFERLAKRFFLLDTFNGFPEEHRALAAPCHVDDYDECFAEAQRTFAGIPNAVLIRGAIPATLGQVPPGPVAYLSIDMNCAEPEIAAAEHFWDRLTPGAVVLLDDYGYSDHYLRQKRAFDAFAAERGTQVLLLPTGQGMLVKK